MPAGGVVREALGRGDRAAAGIREDVLACMCIDSGVSRQPDNSPAQFTLRSHSHHVSSLMRIDSTSPYRSFGIGLTAGFMCASKQGPKVYLLDVE